MFSWQLRLDFEKVFGHFNLAKHNCSYQFKKWLMNKENIFLFSIGYNKVFSQLTFFFKIFDRKTFRYANNSWSDSVIWNQNVCSENSQKFRTSYT